MHGAADPGAHGGEAADGEIGDVPRLPKRKEELGGGHMVKWGGGRPPQGCPQVSPPWSRRPGPGAAFCRRTSRRSPPVSCSAGRRSRGKGAGSRPPGPAPAKRGGGHPKSYGGTPKRGMDPPLGNGGAKRDPSPAYEGPGSALGQTQSTPKMPWGGLKRAMGGSKCHGGGPTCHGGPPKAP